MKKTKKLLLMPVGLLLLLAMVFPLIGTPTASAIECITELGDSPYIKELDGIDIDESQFYSSQAVTKLPDGISNYEKISVIVMMNTETVFDAYERTNRKLSFSEFYASDEAKAVKDAIEQKMLELTERIDEAQISYDGGDAYNTVASGFELTLKAKHFDTLVEVLGKDARVVISDTYNVSETQLVENIVDVYETGIFNSSKFPYQGDGTVIAVLDTGLDYYHSAFNNFYTSDKNDKTLGLTFDEVAKLMTENELAAERINAGLTASDVFVSSKVPFAFDYADYDSDVYPLRSHHGTHVSGIIAGKDDTITGVAPNAQLVEMKIFSDVMDTARSSWILSALEDCVILGVDVINLSIGTSCGFSTESEKETLAGVYDMIRDAGISLIVAASNSFNSGYGSEKNGNLDLTSNPDSGTVGSPATYDGALAIASVEGEKTAYLLWNGKIVYFNESTSRGGDEKDFVEELLGKDRTSIEIEFIKVPGVGRSADYSGIDVKGKIAVVSRGSNTFEEKVNTAEQMGAAGIIIYNNVSGDILMNVGTTTIPACSISQDDGEMLAEAGRGTIKIAVDQAAGPFISDFSSWGPSPNLELKPELTAHGGSILSAVPGQDYDRISGTSMATPNVSGVVALLRQHLKVQNPGISDVELTARINRLLMSTADIVYNKNGLAYSPRKQGAGLANLNNAAYTTAYILTYARDGGSVMDKSKIELGDDPSKSGKYTLVFSVENFGKSALTYSIDAFAMTEGVSETKTGHGETTVTQDGVLLDGAIFEISALSGGTLSGSDLTVAAGASAKITMTLTLTEENKKYLDESFENGMYVEGFVTLNSSEEDGIDLSVPYLAFYGDWTVAPIFDLDYFETNKDELDASLDLEDKNLPDAYATRPIGGLSGDYVGYLGSFYYEQEPGSDMIAADRKYISLSNQAESINSLRYVWAGLLRGAKKVVVTITEDSTGKVVYRTVDDYVRKSYSDGGASIYPANIEVEFSAIDANLKNNTAYTVTCQAYLDYGNGGLETNKNNTFSFPFVTDFEAPSVTGCEFYTEYDKTAKRNRLYAKIGIYDNHYAMAGLVGYVGYDSAQGTAMFYNFDQYLQQIYSDFNSTTYMVYELTDYVDDIKANAYNKNTFTIMCYDYALNTSTFEIALPVEYTDLYFEEESVFLSPNQTYKLSPVTYPGTEWSELLEYSSTNKKVATVVGGEVLALEPGETVIRARTTDGKVARLNVTVMSGDKDSPYYSKDFRKYDKPVVQSFSLSGYITNKAYFFLNNEDRDIGQTGDTRKFVGASVLSMYPSESVTLLVDYLAYFPDVTEIAFETSDESIVTVDKFGTVIAKAEGNASVTVRVKVDGQSTYYSKSVSVEVKDPYVTNGPQLLNYFGNGGYVKIPEELCLTHIGQFAFSNYNYIDKGPNDEISEEMPETTKIWYIGEDTIEEIVIPEGVEEIGMYAFAGLTALKKVTFPSTLKNISNGAFYGCTSLEKLEGIEHVKFINQEAFANCSIKGALDLESAVAISDYAFANNTKITELKLSEDTRSIAAYAFSGNTGLTTLSIKADKIKLGAFAFNGCAKLNNVSINASVIPAGAFNECKALTNVTIGKDVEVIGEYAFSGTGVTSFTVENGNGTFFAQSDKPYLLSEDGKTLMLVAPAIESLEASADITSVASGAFSGNLVIKSVKLPGVTKVGDYAFAECSALTGITLGSLSEIGKYAFYRTAISDVPSFENVDKIGDYAFAFTKITEAVIPNGTTVGSYAFAECSALRTVVIRDNVKVGRYAFSYARESNFDTSFIDVGKDRYFYYIYTCPIESLTIGKDVTLESGAFFGVSEIKSVTLGEGAYVGDYAFYNADMLEDIDLSKVTYIGDHAFSGDIVYYFSDQDFTTPAVNNAGTEYLFRYYSTNLTKIDLLSATRIGDEAFAYCGFANDFERDGSKRLESVNLGEAVTELSPGVFSYCTELTAINLDKIETIGEYAFVNTKLGTTLGLDSIVTIGAYAFTGCEELRRVNLGEGIRTIAVGAFTNATELHTVSGLENATYIGDHAFAYTDIRSADLTSAEYIGSYAFMKRTLIPFKLKLGESIREIGDDNPFAYCLVEPITKTVTETFGENTYEKTLYTFDLGDSVKIIDGSLYYVVPNGLVLVAYFGEADSVNVAMDTVRIAAGAFIGNDHVKNVVLPYTLESIGHKAFFDCDSLALVTFTSYNAPILEEEYDYLYYMSGEGIPCPYIIENVDYGLGIIDYFMWNVESLPTNVFYGATFKDYIGQIEDKIVMIAPSNGKNYDSFIFGQYFDLALAGDVAANDTTLAAIAAIAKLPDRVSLSDKPLVLAAREAYDKIATNDQRTLVTDYARLTKAESRIADLEYVEDPSEPDVPTEPEKPSENAGSSPAPAVKSDGVSTGAAIGIAIVTLLAGLAFGAVGFNIYNKKKYASASSKNSEEN